MKRLATICAVMSGMVGAPATAAVHVFNFLGTVTAAQQTAPIGSAFSGSFSYDTDTPVGLDYGPGRIYYQTAGDFHIDASGYGFSTATYQVAVQQTPGSYVVQAAGRSSNADGQLTFGSPSDIGDLSLPGSLPGGGAGSLLLTDISGGYLYGRVDAYALDAVPPSPAAPAPALGFGLVPAIAGAGTLRLLRRSRMPAA